MYKYRLFFTVISISLSIHLQAQNSLNATIDGKLSDEKFKPLSGVVICLWETVTNTSVDSTIAKTDGTFKFSLSKSGLYQLVFRKTNGVLDSSFIFSVGQLYPGHNKKLLLSFTFFDTQNGGTIKSQRRQFGGTYDEWFTSVPANLLVSLIAEYEQIGKEHKSNIIGTTLNNSSREFSKTIVTLFTVNEDRKIAETVSDEKGKYYFNEIPSGIYYLVFTKNEKDSKGGLFEVKSGWQVILKDMFRNL